MAIEDPRLTRRITPVSSTPDPNYSGVFDTLAKGGIQLGMKVSKQAKLDRVASSVLAGQKLLDNSQIKNGGITARIKVRRDFISKLPDTNPDLSPSDILTIANTLKVDKDIRLTKIGNKYVNVDNKTGAVIGEYGKTEPTTTDSNTETTSIEKAYKNNVNTLNRGKILLANTNSLAEEDLFPAIRDENTAKKLAGVSIEASRLMNNTQDILDNLNGDYEGGLKNIAQLDDMKATAKAQVLTNLRKLGLLVPMNEGLSDVYDGLSKNSTLAGNMPTRLAAALKKDFLNMLTPENYTQLNLTDKDIQDAFSSIDSTVKSYEQTSVERGALTSSHAKATQLHDINKLELEVQKIEMYKSLSPVKQKMILQADIMEPLIAVTGLLKEIGLTKSALSLSASMLNNVAMPNLMDAQLENLESSIEKKDGFNFVSQVLTIDPTIISFMSNSQRVKYLKLTDSILTILEEQKNKETSTTQKTQITNVLDKLSSTFTTIKDLANNKEFNKAVGRLRASIEKIKESN